MNLARRPDSRGGQVRVVNGFHAGTPGDPGLATFFGAGFECSRFIRRSGRRVDLIAETAHDRLALEDYERLRRENLGVAREGARWHLIEKRPGEYDFGSVVPIVRAARATNIRVVWDLCHFGWPDHLELFSPDFAVRLAEYGAALARWLAGELPAPVCFVPVNEISFFSWAAGDEGSMYPFETGRGFELKRRLVTASIAAIKAIRSVAPGARFVSVDPVIHVLPKPGRPDQAEAAEAYRISQYQAWDMLAGRVCPELGGSPACLDIIGVNYYPYNQWYYNLKGTRRVGRFLPITRRNPDYRPLREILAEVHDRYRRTIWIAETGAENQRRGPWLRYVCEEARAALRAGVPLRGICLYPILSHPGWVDDRHCRNGLWDYPEPDGERQIYEPLARELRAWAQVFAGASAPSAASPRAFTGGEVLA